MTGKVHRGTDNGTSPAALSDPLHMLFRTSNTKAPPMDTLRFHDRQSSHPPTSQVCTPPEPRLITRLKSSPSRTREEGELLAAWGALVAECEILRARMKEPVIVTHAMRRSFDDAVVDTQGFYLDAGIVAVIDAWRKED